MFVVLYVYCFSNIPFGTYPETFEPTVSEGIPEIILGFTAFWGGKLPGGYRCFFVLKRKCKSSGFSTETPMTSFATTATTSVTVCPCWGSQCDGDGDDEQSK